MRRTSRSALALLAAFPIAPLACSPAAPKEVVVAPKPKPLAPPKPEPVRSKWVFFDQGGYPRAELDLGAKGTLQVGDHGRRWILSPTGEVTHASSVVSQPLYDVRPEGSGTNVLLVGRDGTVFVAADALGPVLATRPGPAAKLPLPFQAGKQAILGVDAEGVLHRSVDAGVTWSSTKLPLGPGERVVSLVANARGEALVLLHPQRVLHSSDDGATFSVVTTPGIGAEELTRDAAGDLWLQGAPGKIARFVGSGTPRFDPSGAPVAFKTQAAAASAKPQKTHGTQRALAGAREVTIEQSVDAKKKKVAVSVTPIGAAAGTPTELDTVSQWGKVRVAGSGATVVVSIHDDQADPPVTKVRRTTDDGKTWETIGTIEGREGYAPVQLAAGPAWVVVGPHCESGGGLFKKNSGKNCTTAQVKIGNKDWKELDLPPFTTVSDWLFDTAHDRVLLVTSHGDEHPVLAAKLSDGQMVQSEVTLPKGQLTNTSLDGSGHLRAVYASPSRVIKVSLADGKAAPPVYLPFQSGQTHLVGDRGFAQEGDKAWETNDGGDHWLPVAAGPGGQTTCTVDGCVSASALRVGWDLAEGEAGPLASTAEPAAQKEASPPPPAKKPKLAITCTPNGAAKKIASGSPAAAMSSLDGDVRFLAPASGEGGSTSVQVARGNAAPTTHALLGPKASTGKEVRSWAETTPRGVVDARFSFQLGTGKYEPVDVELAWYDAQTNKVAKAKIAKVSPFRVGRSTRSAMMSIVDGGLVFLPLGNTEAPLYFVHDNGKVDALPRPPKTNDFDVWDRAIKLGDRLVLAQDGLSVTLASTTTGGKSWSTTTWSMGTGARLARIGDKPGLLVREGSESPLSPELYTPNGGHVDPQALLAFDALTPDPPALSTFDAAKFELGPIVACTDKARAAGVSANLWLDAEADVVVQGKKPEEKASYPLDTHVVRVGPEGSVCTDGLAAYGTEEGENYKVFIAPHDLAHAWLTQWNWTDKGYRLTSLTCKIE